MGHTPSFLKQLAIVATNGKGGQLFLLKTGDGETKHSQCHLICILAPNWTKMQTGSPEQSASYIFVRTRILTSLELISIISIWQAQVLNHIALGKQSVPPPPTPLVPPSGFTINSTNIHNSAPHTSMHPWRHSLRKNVQKGSSIFEGAD